MAKTTTRSTKKKPPTATTVLLVRHGQTPTTGKVLPGRAKGLHLADAGVQQAQTAADHIASLQNVAAVYSSPLERAKETAAPISKALGLRTRVDRGLFECDFGEWTGGELKKLMKLDSSDPVETVMSLELSERPGTTKGPRDTHYPSPTPQSVTSMPSQSLSMPSLQISSASGCTAASVSSQSPPSSVKPSPSSS